MINALKDLCFNLINALRPKVKLGTITRIQAGYSFPVHPGEINVFVHNAYVSCFCFPEKGDVDTAYIDYTTGKGYFFYRGQYHDTPVYFDLPPIDFDKFGKGYRINKHAQIKAT